MSPCLPMLTSHFYPRSPRGERPGRCSSSYVSVIFLSTLPARGATPSPPIRRKNSRPISIHAPREGSDHQFLALLTVDNNFYPRSPRGERHHLLLYGVKIPDLFLSTLPARGATTNFWHYSQLTTISIHAPREGSD